LATRGINIQIQCGHQMNWELGNYVAAEQLIIPMVGIYMKINNKALDRIFINLRSKKGTVLVAANQFRDKMHSVFTNQYVIGLAADQNPARPEYGNWLYFFSKPVPFITGPDKGAMRNNSAVVFVQMVKIKRGRYEFRATVVTENAANLKGGELTVLYRDFLEKVITEYPDNYLWTHRRYKWDYSPEYKWIDNRNPPLNV
jgi:KDO2-lipid IV(A) lauroyltransferase